MATGDDGRVPKDHEKDKNPPMYGSVYTKTWLNGTKIEISNDDKNPFIDVYTHAMNKINIRPDGTMTIVTTGDKCDYDMCGSTSTTDNNKDHKGYGVEKQQSSTKNEEVPGKDGMAAGGDIAFVCMGKANIRCQSAYIGTDKDCNINCGGNMDIQVAGNFSRTVGGTDSTNAAKITHN